jgi:hypothetical protein
LRILGNTRHARRVVRDVNSEANRRRPVHHSHSRGGRRTASLRYSQDLQSLCVMGESYQPPSLPWPRVPAHCFGPSPTAPRAHVWPRPGGSCQGTKNQGVHYPDLCAGSSLGPTRFSQDTGVKDSSNQEDRRLGAGTSLPRQDLAGAARSSDKPRARQAPLTVSVRLPRATTSLSFSLCSLGCVVDADDVMGEGGSMGWPLCSIPRQGRYT